MLPRSLIALAAGLTLFASAVGCAPVTVGARALHPAQITDTPTTWVYLQTNDAEKDGIYRCYDNGGNPQCKKAVLSGR